MKTNLALKILLPVLLLAAAFPVRAGVIATSSTEFSGVQSQNGWTYGYRDVPAVGASENYDPDRDFTPFIGGEGRGDWNGSTQQWTGTGWKASDGSELTGTSSRPGGSTRWAVRRWQAAELTEKGPVSLRWTLAKQDLTCGNGVTGALYINGQLADKTTIAFDRATTVTRTYYAMLCPADRVDLVLRPLGIDGTDDAQCDNALMSLVVNTTITAANPKQPNGRSFLSALTTPKFDIVSQTRAAAGDQVTLKWRSRSAATYGVEASSDLVNWTRIKTGIVGSPCQSSLIETIADSSQGQRYYRVVEEAKTLAGWWVGNYGNVSYGLVQITVNGNQAVATLVIGPYLGLVGVEDWQADLTTGEGTGVVGIVDNGGNFKDATYVPSKLKIISPDRLTLHKLIFPAPDTYHRVD